MRRSRYTDVKKCRKTPDGEMIIQARFYSKQQAKTRGMCYVVLIASTKQQIEGKTARMDEEARRVGLKINMEKTTI